MKSYLPFLLILMLLSAACGKNLSYTFELPKEEIQKKMDEKFPLKPDSQEKEKSPLALTISDPVVLLEDGKDQIGIKVNIYAEPTAAPPQLKKASFNSLQGPGLPKPGEKNPPLPPGNGKKPPLPAPPAPPAPPKPHFTGSAIVFASITYDPNGKAIHLSNPKTAKLEIAQLPEPMYQPLSQIAESKLAEKFAEKPIPLESKNELDKAVTTFLKTVTVKNGKLLVEIGR
jgi:hypothetical protein